MKSSHAGEDTQKSLRLRLGAKVFAVLIVLSVAEWYMALARVPALLWYLVVINLVDAGLIAYYFMHIAQLWGGEEPSPSGH
ncbi:MAG TPA: cytochrome C oxidase subunit IV family protein [bacterium]|nr:cytochrome C oxidase subunit IV family protein [bacterium]